MPEVSSKSLPPIPNKPGVSNWVEKKGGLPSYIERIAKHIQANGKSTSTAIASAINTVKRWAAGGTVREGGGAKVTAKTQALAAKALAQWESMKASVDVESDMDLAQMFDEDEDGRLVLADDNVDNGGALDKGRYVLALSEERAKRGLDRLTGEPLTDGVKDGELAEGVEVVLSLTPCAAEGTHANGTLCLEADSAHIVEIRRPDAADDTTVEFVRLHSLPMALSASVVEKLTSISSSWTTSTVMGRQAASRREPDTPFIFGSSDEDIRLSSRSSAPTVIRPRHAMVDAAITQLLDADSQVILKSLGGNDTEERLHLMPRGKIINFDWDPDEHPRNLIGRFTKVLKAMDGDSRIDLPDGTFVDVRETSSNHYEYRVNGDGEIVDTNAADAARTALDASSLNDHPEAIGGREIKNIDQLERAGGGEKPGQGDPVTTGPGKRRVGVEGTPGYREYEAYVDPDGQLDWEEKVKAHIRSKGLDPDKVEVAVEGFGSEYFEWADDPEGFADASIAEMQEAESVAGRRVGGKSGVDRNHKVAKASDGTYSAYEWDPHGDLWVPLVQGVSEADVRDELGGVPENDIEWVDFGKVEPPEGKTAEAHVEPDPDPRGMEEVLEFDPVQQDVARVDEAMDEIRRRYGDGITKLNSAGSEITWENKHDESTFEFGEIRPDDDGNLWEMREVDGDGNDVRVARGNTAVETLNEYDRLVASGETGFDDPDEPDLNTREGRKEQEQSDTEEWQSLLAEPDDGKKRIYRVKYASGHEIDTEDFKTKADLVEEWDLDNDALRSLNESGEYYGEGYDVQEITDDIFGPEADDDGWVDEEMDDHLNALKELTDEQLIQEADPDSSLGERFRPSVIEEMRRRKIVPDEDGKPVKKGDKVRFTMFMESGPGAPQQKPDGPFTGTVREIDKLGGLWIDGDEDYQEQYREWAEAEGVADDPGFNAATAYLVEPGNEEKVWKIGSGTLKHGATKK